jgi:replicative DNA helicase
MELNTESIILKSLISNGEFFGKSLPILEYKYFQDVANQNIFKLLKEHYNTYKIIPTITEIVASIQKVPNEETRTSIINNIRIINAIEASTNLEFLLDTTVMWVKDSMYMEAIILGSDALTEKSEEKKIKAKAIMEEMNKISVDSDLGLDFDDIEEMITYYQEKLLGISTAHAELNKRLGAGFLPQTLSVIMAASGIGKSLLMTDLISGQMKEGKNVLLVSMEMMDKEIMKRIHANALDLPINDLRNLPPEVVRNAYNREKDKCGKFFVKDFPNGSFSANMLDNLIESYKIEKGIEFDIVYLDYLGIMKSDLITPNAGLYSYVKSIVEEVRAIAKKRKIPIVSASQLNRCLQEDTIIHLKDVLKPIKNVEVGDILSNGLIVVNKESTGKQKVYKITTKSGKHITTTVNHKFPTNIGVATLAVGLKVGLKLHTKEKDSINFIEL